MNATRLSGLVIGSCLAVAVTAAGAAEITLFEGPNFQGPSMTFRGDSNNLDPIGFNDRASSIIVVDGVWETCIDAYFQGGCTQLRPGRYPQLDGRLNRSISSLRVLQGTPATQGYAAPDRRVARAILYEGPNFQGRPFAISGDVVANFANAGFNDRASSMRVEDGYWLFCSDAQFEGECQTFGPGEYPTLPWGLDKKVSSGRRIYERYPYDGRPNWRR